MGHVITPPGSGWVTDQAEQLLAHFDDEERFDLVTLYGRALSIIETEIGRMT